MSIYATLWILKFPSNGDAYSRCDWMTVMAQGVPAHIGTPTRGYGYESGDPYAAFLPPAVEVDDGDQEASLRAVVIVRTQTQKVGQEYIGPLLVLSGEEYAALPFHALHDRICDALRGDRPRLVAETISPGEPGQLIFEDGSVQKRPVGEDQ